jgi:hypothetical protein
MLKGRGFQPSDMRAGNYFAPNSVAIVDEELAKRLWPNGDALGGGVSWSPTGPWARSLESARPHNWKDLAGESRGHSTYRRTLGLRRCSSTSGSSYAELSVRRSILG